MKVSVAFAAPIVPPGAAFRVTTTSQKREAVPRRARISGSWTLVSLNSRLESNKEEKVEGLRLEFYGLSFMIHGLGSTALDLGRRVQWGFRDEG